MTHIGTAAAPRKEYQLERWSAHEFGGRDWTNYRIRTCKCDFVYHICTLLWVKMFIKKYVFIIWSKYEYVSHVIQIFCLLRKTVHVNLLHFCVLYHWPSRCGRHHSLQVQLRRCNMICQRFKIEDHSHLRLISGFHHLIRKGQSSPRLSSWW